VFSSVRGHPELLAAFQAGASNTCYPIFRREENVFGNWLRREQAKEPLAAQDRSTLKGKRDYVILALLVGCALRRQEHAQLDVEKIQMREGRWVIANLRGKGGRIRTPEQVKFLLVHSSTQTTERYLGADRLLCCWYYISRPCTAGAVWTCMRSNSPRTLVRP
jgi:hypothetical protein